MRALMFPSMHPYVSKLSFGDKIIIVNANTDYFSLPNFGIEFIETNHPLSSYDVVHIHFSFDKVEFETLKQVLVYFRSNNKPIIWTCHSKESQRKKNYHNGAYQKLLFKYSDKIITLTYGCKKWIESHWGYHSKKIDVIPHGLIAMPSDVVCNTVGIEKNKKRFTILYGDFRDNKERINAVSEFLNAKQLSDCELHLIYKPFSMSNISNLDELGHFERLIDNTRCSKYVNTWITNEELIKHFFSSHCIILPYLWGTHSGQIELAKDCGCHIVAHNVGFYKEQWDKTILWGEHCENKTYLDALMVAYNAPCLSPIGNIRICELNDIIEKHIKIYQELLYDCKKV